MILSKPDVAYWTGPWTRLLARWKELRAEGGNAVVEAAVIVSFLAVPMLAGTGEMALVVYDSIEVSNAAYAAASYGMQSSTYAANSSAMVTAARAEASDFGAALTATPTTYYACSISAGSTTYTGVTAFALATAACTGGTNHALEFVQVTTSATVTPAIHCPGLPTSFTLHGSSVMEVEQ